MAGSMLLAQGSCLARLRVEIKRRRNSCVEKCLLKQKLDPPREHTLKEKGCGSPRLTGTAVLEAPEVGATPSSFLVAPQSMLGRALHGSCTVFLHARTCIAGLSSIRNLHLEVFLTMIMRNVIMNVRRTALLIIVHTPL